MPKKDTSSAVLGMLSNVGAQTRRSVTVTEPADIPEQATSTPREPVSAAPIAPQSPAISDPQSVRPVSELPRTRPATKVDEAPRTLRLRTATAIDLRAAWVEAKRDDVFLTAQDFASNLIEEALANRRRGQRSARP